MSRRLLYCPQVVDPGHRHEHVAAHGADRVLDRPLLVARAGVAEREREPVVRGEALEGVGGADRLADAAADARGVVEHEPRRHALAEPEDRLQPLADAFRVLAPEALGQGDVGERERHDEVVHLAHDSQDSEIADAEVDLGLRGSPFEVQELVLRPLELGLPGLHVLLHDGVAAVEPALRHEAVVDALGRMALLGAALAILQEPRVDHRLVRVELGSPLPPGLQRGGEVVHVALLAHGRLRHPLVPGDLGDAVAGIKLLPD